MTAEGRARLQLLAAAALFSTGGAAIKYCQLDAWGVAAFRSGIAALALFLLLPAARRGMDWHTPLVGCAYATTLILFVAGNKLTTSAATIFLQSTAPLYLVLLGPWLLREPVRRADLGMMLALGAGLGMMFLGGDAPQATAPDPVRGNTLALLSGVAWALTLAGLRWIARGGREGGAAAAAAGNVIAFLFCLPFALPLPAPSAGDVASLLFLGVFQIGLAYALLTSGMGHVAALPAALLLLLEPVLNPVWSWLVHGERPGGWTLAGGALVLCGTVLPALRRPVATNATGSEVIATRR